MIMFIGIDFAGWNAICHAFCTIRVATSCRWPLANDAFVSFEEDPERDLKPGGEGRDFELTAGAFLG